MYPTLYPSTSFSDTGILEHYRAEHDDDSNRIVSVGYSWTRKVLSGVRAYGEQKNLPFFLYEKHTAMQYPCGDWEDLPSQDPPDSRILLRFQKDAASKHAHANHFLVDMGDLVD